MEYIGIYRAGDTAHWRADFHSTNSEVMDPTSVTVLLENADGSSSVGVDDGAKVDGRTGHWGGSVDLTGLAEGVWWIHVRGVVDGRVVAKSAQLVVNRGARREAEVFDLVLLGMMVPVHTWVPAGFSMVTSPLLTGTQAIVVRGTDMGAPDDNPFVDGAVLGTADVGGFTIGPSFVDPVDYDAVKLEVTDIPDVYLTISVPSTAHGAEQYTIKLNAIAGTLNVYMMVDGNFLYEKANGRLGRLKFKNQYIRRIY